MWVVVLAAAAGQSCAERVRIGFSSCVNQNRASAALEAVGREASLEAFVFLGDNGYHDTPSCGIPWAIEACSAWEWLGEVGRLWVRLWRRAWRGAAAEDSLRRADDYRDLTSRHVGPLRRMLPSTAFLATWDDHDLGANDADSTYPFLSDALSAFVRFWRRPDMELEYSGGGASAASTVYKAYRLKGDIQVLLLDVRSYRTPLTRAFGSAWKLVELAKLARLRAADAICEPREYEPSEGTMLGVGQWQWLEERLAEPARVRVVVSSIQVLRPDDGAESWANMPREKERLLAALEGASGQVIILSGDVHYGEVSVLGSLTEVTASGLTETWPCVHYNPLAVDGSLVRTHNYGIADIDFANNATTLSLHNARGNMTFRLQLEL
ncbi:hypothetical protein CTAYLR_008903 [Chrysophaeum taylorii]|uniref:PhoD-like phosphatase metallophosphatase domain-containing protein n=1 Tax=Chrysophaeum taylorii TaxID=2483200 RepID=A0AAD7UI92_9STRA|nr:hypothetical protein CTAYLR_008903 [Chrysophaeum taylorii]